MADVSLFIESNAGEVSKSFSKLSNSIVGSVGRAKALADAMSFADAAFNKGKISGQQYSRIINQLDKEEDRLYSSLGQVNTQINKQSVSLSQNTRVVSNAAVAAKRLTDAQRLAGKSTNKFGMYSQQVGYQVGDFFVQVQSGTDALVAFGQQGTQLAGLLPGLIGAIAGIGLSLGTALLRSRMQAQGLAFDFQKMKEDVLAALEPIKPLIDVIGDALVFVRDKLASFGRFILDNLDRIITYGITAASIFGVRLVA